MIPGSSTFSTRMSFAPYQHNARISSRPFRHITSSSRRLTVGGRYFTRFHQVFEATDVLLHEHGKNGIEQPGHGDACSTGRGAIFYSSLHLRPPSMRKLPEPHLSGVVDVRPVE